VTTVVGEEPEPPPEIESTLPVLCETRSGRKVRCVNKPPSPVKKKRKADAGAGKASDAGETIFF